MLTRMGVASMDYKQLSEQIELKTGGLDVSPLITEHHSERQHFEQVNTQIDLLPLSSFVMQLLLLSVLP